MTIEKLIKEPQLLSRQTQPAGEGPAGADEVATTISIEKRVVHEFLNKIVDVTVDEWMNLKVPILKKRAQKQKQLEGTIPSSAKADS